jgi:alpha-methylacyl-CoA racemase
MGPLSGFRIIELAGIGPGPFCGMMLSDMGAEVIRVDRLGAGPGRNQDVLTRNRRSIAVDLKKPEGVDTVLRLVETADALFEGFRPGVTERLGLGPDDCLARNPKLVYGRMTGWGQDGPMAQAAGHDINYIGLSGALHAIGRPGEKPVPPLNLVGDFGGGGMLLAFGLVCGMLEAQKSGKGQVVDAAMVDGAAALMAMFFTMGAAGAFKAERGTNLLDGGAHFYDTYETADGKHVCIGSIEPQFYALLVEKAGLDGERFKPQMDASQWPALKAELTRVFKTRTRDEWCAIMEGSDVCFAPVLSIFEAPDHPHNRARNSFVELGGVVQPAPAPRFSRTAPAVSHPSRAPGQDTEAVLADCGFSAEEIATLVSQGAVGGPR